MTDLLALLQEFYRDKLTMLLRHQAGARSMAQYDVNNTYQYILNREETQLSWIAKAIAELGGVVGDEPGARSEECRATGPEASRRILEEDARE